MSLEALAWLRDHRQIEATQAFAVTPEWAAGFQDADEEALEDAALYERTAPVVVVAQVPAEIQPGYDGAVTVLGQVPLDAVQAVFVRHGEDYLWHGPTELDAAIAEAQGPGGWHSS